MATVAEVARRLNSEAVPHDGPLPPLLLMTDARRLADPRPALRRLPKGAAVIFRHYGVADREDIARELLAACRRRGLLFLVAADASLARRIGADGLHLPEFLVRRRREWAPRARSGWVITAAAHSPGAIRRAAAAGAQAVLVSPVFATPSHPGAGALGILRFVRWCRESPLPVYALGGIHGGNARRLLGSGACGIAGIGGLADVEGTPAPC